MTMLCITAAMTVLSIALLAGFGFRVDPSSEMAATRVSGFKRRELGEDIMG